MLGVSLLIVLFNLFVSEVILYFYGQERLLSISTSGGQTDASQTSAGNPLITVTFLIPDILVMTPSTGHSNTGLSDNQASIPAPDNDIRNIHNKGRLNTDPPPARGNPFLFFTNLTIK